MEDEDVEGLLEVAEEVSEEPSKRSSPTPQEPDLLGGLQ